MYRHSFRLRPHAGPVLARLASLGIGLMLATPVGADPIFSLTPW
jgi:hypothetical protein